MSILIAATCRANALHEYVPPKSHAHIVLDNNDLDHPTVTKVIDSLPVNPIDVRGAIMLARRLWQFSGGSIKRVTPPQFACSALHAHTRLRRPDARCQNGPWGSRSRTDPNGCDGRGSPYLHSRKRWLQARFEHVPRGVHCRRITMARTLSIALAVLLCHVPWPTKRRPPSDCPTINLRHYQLRWTVRLSELYGQRCCLQGFDDILARDCMQLGTPTNSYGEIKRAAQ